MDETEFKAQTIVLGLRIIELARGTQRDIATDVLLRQAIRSGTSVVADCHAACRARSDTEMLAKLAYALAPLLPISALHGRGDVFVLPPRLAVGLRGQCPAATRTDAGR